MIENRFYSRRDEMVEYVKYIGQFILDNAEDIVGNYHSVTVMTLSVMLT